MNNLKLFVTAFAAGVIVSCASVSAMADSTGWKQDESGNWRYYTSDTQYVAKNWKSIDGNWFYFDENGSALIDRWEKIAGKLYHFDSNGHMEKNKWIDCGEHTLYEEEYAYAEEYPEYAKVVEEYLNKRDWRYVGSDGAAYIGWKKLTVNGITSMTVRPDILLTVHAILEILINTG